jgi:hypothetical protein
MKAGQVICEALVAGKSYRDIHELLKASHPTGEAALSLKSCQEQVAWYRSQLRHGHIFLSSSGELLDLKRKKHRGHPRYLKDNLGDAAAATPENGDDCGQKPITVNTPDATYLKSTFYQQLVEHVFIAEVLQEAWFGFGEIVEVLRAEVDSWGYDIVFECRGILRHVQLKTSKHDGRRSTANLNIALADKPGGCVVWLLREDDHTTRRVKLAYLFFGGAPGEKLPPLDGFAIGKHSKGNSKGKKNERPAIRLVPKTKFLRIATIREVVVKFFGLTDSLDGEKAPEIA